MIDRDEARLWADHHHDFTRSAADLWHALEEALTVLARIQYDKPWARPATRARHRA